MLAAATNAVRQRTEIANLYILNGETFGRYEFQQKQMSTKIKSTRNEQLDCNNENVSTTQIVGIYTKPSRLRTKEHNRLTKCFESA